MKQIEISRNKRHSIVFVEDHQNLKQGNSIRFKDDDRFWNIDKVYDEVNKENINRGWHVGGL